MDVDGLLQFVDEHTEQASGGEGGLELVLDNAAWSAALEGFLSTNADAKSFSNGREGHEGKHKLLAALFRLLSSYAEQNGSEPWAPSTACAVLEVLRVVFREKEGMEKVADAHYAGVLLDLSLVSSAAAAKWQGRGPSDEQLQVAACAVKCLVNYILQLRQDTPILSTLAGAGAVVGIVAALQHDRCTQGISYALCRILAYIAADGDLRKQCVEQPVFTTLVKVLKRSGNLEEEECRSAVAEALQAIFVLSTDMGPLGEQVQPSEQQLAAFHELTELIKGYLECPLDEAHIKLLQNTIRCLVNLPTPCTVSFQPELTLEKLLAFFCHQMNRDDGNEAANLTPILIILTSIARAVPRARPIILDTIMPRWKTVEPRNNSMDPPAEFMDQTTLAGKLLLHMTSANVALHHFSAELLFELVGKCEDELVRLCGLGNAAGLLANKGLFAQMQSRLGRSAGGGERRQVDPQAVEEWLERMEQRGLIDENGNVRLAGDPGPGSAGSA